MSSPFTTVTTILGDMLNDVRQLVPRRLRPSAWVAPPGLFSAMLTDRPAWLFALLATMFTYAVANTWMLWDLESDYRSRVLAELETGRAGQVESLQQLLRRMEFSEKNEAVKKPLNEMLSAGVRRPVSEQLLALFQQTTSIPGDKNEQVKLRSLIHEELTGRLSGWRMFVISTEPTTGERLVTRWERFAGSPLQNQQEVRRLLVKFADLAIQEMQPSLRAIARINGWVQWLTFLVAYAILGIAAHRGLAVYRQSKVVGHSDATGDSHHDHFRRLQDEVQPKSSPAVESELIRSRLAEIRAQLDYGPYSGLSFLLGLLPTLGFLGTVWGMGEALLEADGLFSTGDKQQVIHGITAELGFAFDTTLVALMTGMVAGAAVAGVRAGRTGLAAAAGAPVLV